MHSMDCTRIGWESNGLSASWPPNKASCLSHSGAEREETERGELRDELSLLPRSLTACSNCNRFQIKTP